MTSEPLWWDCDALYLKLGEHYAKRRAWDPTPKSQVASACGA